MSLPENLTLVLTEDNDLQIQDAQDVAHVEFKRPASGDPAEWSWKIATSTCVALGVKWGIDEEGEELSMVDIVDLWHERLGMEDGFMLS